MRFHLTFENNKNKQMKKQQKFFGKILLYTVIVFFFFGCNEAQSNSEESTENKLDYFIKVTEEKINEDNFKNTAVKIDTPRSDIIDGNETNSEYKLKGKPDTIIIEFDENNLLLIPGFGPGVYDEENPTPSMYKNYSFVQNNDKINFILSDISGLSGDIRGNELFFETDKNFKIISILCDAQAGIFFNEDGSGGMQEEFKGEKSEKYPAKQTDEYIYEVPNFEGIEDAFTEDVIAQADKKVDENDLLSYDFLISEIIVEIQYSINNQKYIKKLVFKYEYGD